MSIEVKCTGCSQILRVQEADAGKQARCPKCQTTFTVPPPDAAGTGPSLDGGGPTPQPPYSQGQAPYGQQPQAPFGQQGQGQFGQQPQPPFGQQEQPQFGQQSQNPFADKPDPGSQNPYATPQGTYPQTSGRRFRRPHRGGTILTLGILAVCCNLCFIPGICAWTMGNNDLHAMRVGQMDPSGRGLTQAGQILGIIGIVVHVILFFARVALVGVR